MSILAGLLPKPPFQLLQLGGGQLQAGVALPGEGGPAGGQGADLLHGQPGQHLPAAGSMKDFSLVICKPDKKIIYSDCQWSAIQESASIGSMVLEKVTLVASRRIETGV